MFNVFRVIPRSMQGDTLTVEIDLMGTLVVGGVTMRGRNYHYSPEIIAAIESQRHNPHLRRQLINELNEITRINLATWKTR